MKSTTTSKNNRVMTIKELFALPQSELEAILKGYTLVKESEPAPKKRVEKRETSKKESPKTTKKATTSWSPEWTAYKKGTIDIATYNAIIAGKTSLDEVLAKKRETTRETTRKTTRKTSKKAWKVRTVEEDGKQVHIVTKPAKKRAKKQAKKAWVAPVKVERTEDDFSKYNF